MTNEEIITEIKIMRKFNYTLTPIEVFYRVIEALENQTPKKPIIEHKDIRWYYYCPVCGDELEGEGCCCSNNDCRQKIDWSSDDNVEDD